MEQRAERPPLGRPVAELIERASELDQLLARHPALDLQTLDAELRELLERIGVGSALQTVRVSLEEGGRIDQLDPHPLAVAAREIDQPVELPDGTIDDRMPRRVEGHAAPQRGQRSQEHDRAHGAEPLVGGCHAGHRPRARAAAQASAASRGVQKAKRYRTSGRSKSAGSFDLPEPSRFTNSLASAGRRL